MFESVVPCASVVFFVTVISPRIFCFDTSGHSQFLFDLAVDKESDRVEWIKSLQECVEKAGSNERIALMANLQEVTILYFYGKQFDFDFFCFLDKKNGPVTAEAFVPAGRLC